MKRKKEPAVRLNLYPFGGLGEIGMNMLAMEVASDVVVFDCGMMFQDVSALGLDYCLPNFTKLYGLRDKVKGLVLTHGHEDHIGAVGHFVKSFPEIPIYASPLTRDLVMAKQEDFPDLKDKKIRLFHDHKPFKVGGFEITAVCVSHSIPDAHGFVIDSEAGRTIHSGDMRYEYDNLKKFEKKFPKLHYFHRYTNKPILCYLGDSTNVERPNPLKTEDAVAKNLTRYIKTYKDGLLLITMFASNIERLAKLLRGAHSAGKHVLLCGRSLKTYVSIGIKHGLIEKYSGLFIEEDDFDALPKNKVLVIATGSQAEPRAALMRMARGTHRSVALEEGDLILMSSRFIPGNERNISRMINALMIQGAQIITADEEEIHVSGHAYKEESLMTLKALRPQYFIPVHGEFHHMKRHAHMAKSLKGKGPSQVLVIRNGKPVSLGEDGYSELPDFEIERCTYDYGKLTPLICPPISQRKRLGKHGFIVCSLMPEFRLFSMGIFIDDVCLKECKTYRSKLMRTKSLSTDDRLKQMRAFLQRYFRKKYDRKPYVMITEERFQPYDSP